MGRIAAVILSAGKGGRIGCPKHQLRLAGKPFWMMIAGRLKRAGVRDIVLVVRRTQRDRIVAGRGTRLAVNYRPSLGMLSSVKCGLRALKGYSGYMICPVDHPDVKSSTYRALVTAFKTSPKAILRPRCMGRPGHPILVPGCIADEISKCRPGRRLDGLLRRHAGDFMDIRVNDRCTLLNINTKKELEIAARYHRKN